jgi:hypothetical protein
MGELREWWRSRVRAARIRTAFQRVAEVETAWQVRIADLLLPRRPRRSIERDLAVWYRRNRMTAPRVVWAPDPAAAGLLAFALRSEPGNVDLLAGLRTLASEVANSVDYGAWVWWQQVQRSTAFAQASNLDDHAWQALVAASTEPAGLAWQWADQQLRVLHGDDEERLVSFRAWARHAVLLAGFSGWERQRNQARAQVVVPSQSHRYFVWLSWLSRIGARGRRLHLGSMRAVDRLANALAHVDGLHLYRNLAIAVEPPRKLLFGRDGRLHSTSGPAIEHPSGLCGWHLEGTAVPELVVENPERIPAAMFGMSREARIAAKRHYGVAQYLEQRGHLVLDASLGVLAPTNAGHGCVVGQVIQDVDGDHWYVANDGTSDRLYHMPIPISIRNCADAAAFLAGSRRAVQIVAQC